MLKFAKRNLATYVVTGYSNIDAGTYKFGYLYRHSKEIGWYFEPTEINLEPNVMRQITEKLYSLNKELRDEVSNLAEEFDYETGKQGAD
jgi:hypothetical protein